MGDVAHPEPFLGRVEELSSVRSALRPEGAAVAVIGPVGSGTTRLVDEYLRRFARDLPLGGFVESEPDVDALRAAVGDPGPRIAESGPFLLVLDGCERLDADARALLTSWQQSHADLRILSAGTRRPDLARQTVLELGGLPSAAALFVARARSTGADVDPDAPALQWVLESLDFLPAAVEEAASCAAVLGLSDLGRLLEERFTATLPQYAAALTDQSARLSDAHLGALGRLAALPGDFCLELAEAVLGVDAVAALAALQAGSWLRREHAEGGIRFVLPRPIRLWAQSELESGDVLDRADAWSEAMGAAALADLDGAEPRAAEERLVRELHHLRRGGPAARRAAGWVLLRQGLVEDVIRVATGDDAASSRLRARALVAAGRPKDALALLEGNTPEDELARAEAEAAAGRIRDARDRARTVSVEAGLVGAQGKALLARLQSTRGRRKEALTSYREALDAADRLGAARLRAELRAELGIVEVREGHLVAAQRTLTQARDEVVDVGLTALLPKLDLELATLHALDGGNPDLTQALASADGVARRELLRLQGNLALAAGDADLAVEPWAEAAMLARRSGDRRAQARVDCDRAWLAWMLDEPSALRRHLDDAAEAADACSDSGIRLEARVLDAVVRGDRAALAEAETAVDRTTLAALPPQAFLAGALLDPSAERVAHAWSFVSSSARRALARGRLAVVAPALALCADRLRSTLPPAAWQDYWAGALDRDGKLLLVQADGRAMRAPGGAWVDLSRRTQLANLVAELALGHARDRDALLANEDVLEVLWPGEHMDPLSALNRVHQAASRLRKIGLGDLLERLPEGYRIVGNAAVQLLP